MASGLRLSSAFSGRWAAVASFGAFSQRRHAGSRYPSSVALRSSAIMVAPNAVSASVQTGNSQCSTPIIRLFSWWPPLTLGPAPGFVSRILKAQGQVITARCRAALLYSDSVTVSDAAVHPSRVMVPMWCALYLQASRASILLFNEKSDTSLVGRRTHRLRFIMLRTRKG